MHRAKGPVMDMLAELLSHDEARRLRYGTDREVARMLAMCGTATDAAEAVAKDPTDETALDALREADRFCGRAWIECCEAEINVLESIREGRACRLDDLGAFGIAIDLRLRELRSRVVHQEALMQRSAERMPPDVQFWKAEIQRVDWRPFVPQDTAAHLDAAASIHDRCMDELLKHERHLRRRCRWACSNAEDAETRQMACRETAELHAELCHHMQALDTGIMRTYEAQFRERYEIVLGHIAYWRGGAGSLTRLHGILKAASEADA